MILHFLGANRQVTGSRYLLEAGGLRLMIDCGMFQERPYLERNWVALDPPADSVDCLLLTHAHLDHCGLIPRFVRQGFSNPIYTTGATRDLAAVILLDSAQVQAEDAAYKAKRHHREKRPSKHPDAVLYRVDDVEVAMRQFTEVAYDAPVALNKSVRATFRDAGHILGSAVIEVAVRDGAGERTIVFSGDVGRRQRPILRDPVRLDRADDLIMESTYGDRIHPDEGPITDQLADAINATVARGGNVIIPTFAIERAQEIIYHLGMLIQSGRIPRLLVFLDSPMAIDATEVFRRHPECMDAEVAERIRHHETPLQFTGLRQIADAAESKAINQIKGSCVILAGSGMCTAGRVKHHLANNIEREESSVVFVGYQAVGTLGRELVNGAKSVRIHGKRHRVRAGIVQISGLSAHADQRELLTWCEEIRQGPGRVFLTHGEMDASEALAAELRKRGHTDVVIPEYGQSVELK